MQLKIALRVGLEPDAVLAESWKKYLLRNRVVESANIIVQEQSPPDGVHCVIAFQPSLKSTPGVKNVLYLQPGMFGEAVNSFRATQERFYRYCFTSKVLREQCGVDGCVLPYGVDPEVYYPYGYDPKFAHNVSFVGNALSLDQDSVRKYISPAVPFGLVLYGLGWAGGIGEYDAHIARQVYSSSILNLNVHTREEAQTGTISPRVYQVLACGGRLISDKQASIRKVYGDRLLVTEGGEDLADICRFYPKRTRLWPISTFSGEGFIQGISYEARMAQLVAWLQEVL
jgi:hypothetical protein